MKVLAGYVSEHAAYHHGEASLQGAIINMAQTFVGSNNINILMPNGQFGTRIMGGSPTNSKKGSCIQVSYGNIQPTIMGFTVSNGVGTSMIVDDCGVSRTERSGGAIMAFQAYPILSHNRFMNNGVSMFDEDNAVQAIQNGGAITLYDDDDVEFDEDRNSSGRNTSSSRDCLLYTSPSPRDKRQSRMPSSA